MKIKDGFVLREIAGTTVVVPVGQKVVELSLMMTLNGTGSFIWQQLQQETDVPSIVASMTMEYDVAKEKATQDIEAFIALLDQNQLLETQH